MDNVSKIETLEYVISRLDKQTTNADNKASFLLTFSVAMVAAGSILLESSSFHIGENIADIMFSLLIIVAFLSSSFLLFTSSVFSFSVLKPRHKIGSHPDKISNWSFLFYGDTIKIMKHFNDQSNSFADYFSSLSDNDFENVYRIQVEKLSEH